MTKPLRLEFLTSADAPGQLRDTRAEVALLGRSNVGKSSLCNALAGRKQLARTSKTPGRTQLLNQFGLSGGGTLVDLPGYGFADAPKKVRAAWRARMESYLEQRGPLVAVLVLVDGAVGPTALDQEMLRRLAELGRPVRIVATKHDKVKSSKRERRQRDLAAGCDRDPEEVLWTSATAGTGIDKARSLVRGLLS